jgi:hypothetical protein
MIFTSYYFVAPEIFESLFSKCFYSMKILTNNADLSERLPESMSRLTDICWKSIGRFLKVAYVLLIRFPKVLHKPTGRFQLAGHYCENTFSLISSLLKGFSHL